MVSHCSSISEVADRDRERILTSEDEPSSPWLVGCMIPLPGMNRGLGWSPNLVTVAM